MCFFIKHDNWWSDASKTIKGVVPLALDSGFPKTLALSYQVEKNENVHTTYIAQAWEISMKGNLCSGFIAFIGNYLNDCQKTLELYTSLENKPERRR